MTEPKKVEDKPALTVVSDVDAAPPESKQETSVVEPAERLDDRAVLDEFEQLAADTILDDDDGDDPGAKEEITTPLVFKKLPKFCNFRANPETFDLWGTTDDQGMEELVIVTTKEFAPNFEEDVELRRIRFYETVTAHDGLIREVWCPVPEKGKKANLWIQTRFDALEHAKAKWTTMRSRTKLGQYTYRPSRKQEEYGEPKFSGLTRGQRVANLKKLGLLADSKNHPFFKKATDTE